MTNLTIVVRMYSQICAYSFSDCSSVMALVERSYDYVLEMYVSFISLYYTYYESKPYNVYNIHNIDRPQQFNIITSQQTRTRFDNLPVVRVQ